MPPKLKKYSTLFALTFMQGIKNYKQLVGLSLFLITCLVIFSHLWQVAAIRSDSYFKAETLLWYIAFNEWILISVPEIHFDMQEELESGKLAYLLPRPISYIGAKFSEGLALLCLQTLVLGFVTFVFAFLWTASFPFTAFEFLLMLFLGFVAGTVGLIFQMLIGLSSFWLNDITPFNWIWEKLLYVFGGLLLPLSAYPLWMQKIAACTPYAPLLGARSELVFGFHAGQIFSVIGLLIFWFFVGVLALKFLYRRGLNILNIQGG